jgi:outer membrane protein
MTHAIFGPPPGPAPGRPRVRLDLPCLVLLAGILAGGLESAPAAAQARIAYVTSWRIIGPEAEYQGSRDAEQALNRDIETWNRELEEKKKQILDVEQEIEQKRLLVSETKRQELEQRRTQLAGEYERRVKEVYGDGGLVDKRNYELTKGILEKVKEAVSLIAREEGYDFVFDASDANLVWANKDYDLTDRVLAKMAEGLPTQPAGQQQPPPQQQQPGTLPPPGGGGNE